MLTKKISKIQTSLKKNNFAGLILGNFGHQVNDDLLYYLLLRRLELGLLYLPATGRSTLYAVPFEVAELQTLYPKLDILPFSDINLHLAFHTKPNTNLAIRPSAMPDTFSRLVRGQPDVAIIDFIDDKKIMATKLLEEIEILSNAAKFTDEIFSSLLESWQNFTTEEDASQFVISETIRLGLEPSFSPIIASGHNAALPHHHPSNTKLAPGFCVIDMGVRYQGYCSDMSRTIYLGTPTTTEAELYARVLESQTTTINSVHAGTSTHDLDAICRGILGSDLNKEFIHFLGHGLGTQVHEWPRVGNNENIILEENMLITIEPGVYRQKAYGIRIEDDVLVGSMGATVLTKSPKNMLKMPFKN